MSLLACRRVVFRLAAVVAMAFVALPVGLSLASFVASPARAADPAAQLPAAQLIDATVAEVIEIIKTKTGAARQAAIQQVLETKFDLPYMGQIALGAHWAKTTEEQRVRFLKATATAEAKAYSERFGQYAGQTVNVGKMTTRPNGLFIVESRINQSNGQPIKLEWEVRQGAQGLRITDVKVEGVSMVMTRRSDFNSYIQSNGGKVQPLVDELEARARQ